MAIKSTKAKKSRILKDYTVTVAVVMAGDIVVEADSEEEAKEIALKKQFSIEDFRHFYQLLRTKAIGTVGQEV